MVLIIKLAPNKAPGLDKIPNYIIKQHFDILKKYLLCLAQASYDAQHFPTCFKQTTTLVLHKPNKPDYTKPKAYRLIALENMISKVLESIMAKLIMYLCETHKLLSDNHFRGRPGRTTEDAMLLFTKQIYAT